MIYIKDNIPIDFEYRPTKQNKSAYSDGLIPWVKYQREENGVLDSLNIYDTVKSEIQNFTGTQSCYCLRSWWIVLYNGNAVPKHSHRYQMNNRTISGCLYVDGDINPLLIQEPNSPLQSVNNHRGRLVLFDGYCDHWTDPYPGTKTRYTVAFDFLLEDQPLCDCTQDAVCFKCVQNKMDKFNVTIYSGGTDSTDLKNHKWSLQNGAYVKNPQLGKLQHK